MTQEFKRAAEIVNRIVVGGEEWNELFEKHDFFYRYRYYLQVIASTGDAELQLKWYILDFFYKLVYFTFLSGQVRWNLEYASWS